MWEYVEQGGTNLKKSTCVPLEKDLNHPEKLEKSIGSQKATFSSTTQESKLN